MGDILSAFGAWLFTLMSWCLDGILYLFKLCMYLVFDGVLTVITTFFTTLTSVSNFAFSLVADWSGLPSQLGYVIGQVQIPACLTLLMSAVAARMAINLIPSWATRV